MGKKKVAAEPKSKRYLGSGAKFVFFFWFTIDPEKSAVFFLSPKGLRKKTAKSYFIFFSAPEPKSNKDLEKLPQKTKFYSGPKAKRGLGSGAKFLFFFWFTIDPEKSAVFFLSPKGLRKKTAKSYFIFFSLLSLSPTRT